MRKSRSLTPPTLGLRNHAQQVEVIVPNGTTQPVLGTRHPGDGDLRVGASRHFGGPRQSPRRAPPAAIELALSARTQTILTYQLPHEVQARLNGGHGSLAESRRRQDEGSHELIVPD